MSSEQETFNAFLLDVPETLVAHGEFIKKTVVFP